MKFKIYVRDRWPACLIYLLAWALILNFMAACRVPMQLCAITSILLLFAVGSAGIWDYMRKRSFYDQLLRSLDELDRRYLIAEMLPEAGFYEGRLLKEILASANKSMCEHVSGYRRRNQEFQEFIELWVHEIKLPLASVQLMARNHRDTLGSELDRQLEILGTGLEQWMDGLREKRNREVGGLGAKANQPLETPVANQNRRIADPEVETVQQPERVGSVQNRRIADSEVETVQQPERVGSVQNHRIADSIIDTDDRRQTVGEELDGQMDALRADLDQQFHTLQAEIDETLESLGSKMEQQLRTLRSEMDETLESLGSKMDEQLRRMDGFIDTVLYYARSGSAGKDYVIKETSLRRAVSNVAVKNREELSLHEIRLQTQALDLSVMTDGKWLEFMLGQLMANSIRYAADGREREIRIYTSTEASPEHSVRLHFRDNGIGVPPSDLPYLFEKAYTGQNGRIRTRSTGMGLYIVNKLCKKLGHAIEVHSVQGEYTEFVITFGVNDYYMPAIP